MVTSSRNDSWESSGARRCRVPLAAVAFVAVAALIIGSFASGGRDQLAVDGSQATPTVTPGQTQEAIPASTEPGHWAPVDSGRLAARQGAASAWTGRELVVWGGRVSGRHVWFEDGAVYAPGDDQWRPMPPSPLAPRAAAASAWTGDELIVWGGVGRGREPDGRLLAVPLGDGGAYEVRSGRWRRIANSPLAARRDAKAVWTGSKLVVWGGRAHDGGYLKTNGAIYDPAADRWSRLPPSPIDDEQITDVQLLRLGDEVLIWARSLAGHTTAAYNLAERTWRSIPAPRQRPGVTPQLVTLGGTALVWGENPEGRPYASRLAAGDRLWTSAATPPRAPSPSEAFVAAGARAVAWQGAEAVTFDSALNTWTALPEAPPLGPGPPISAWTGDHLLVWHSGGRPGDEGRGALWTPGNPWRRLSPPQPVAAGASAVWTGWGQDGQQLLVWGGLTQQSGGARGGNVAQPVRLGGTPPPDTGARLDGFAYDDALGLWENLPAGPLSPRYDHASVWTGDEMLVLGGLPRAETTSPSQREGAAYDPLVRHWRDLPRSPVPVGAQGAVWTGRQVVVAGVRDRGVDVAAYTPTSDRWDELAAPPLADGAEQVVAVWLEFEVWVIAVYDDGRVSAAGWSPRRRSWRTLPAATGLQAPVTSTWAGARVFLVDAGGRVRSYGRGGTFWRSSPRLPLRSQRLALTWNGYSVLAMDAETGDIATLGLRATAWTMFPDPDLAGSPAAQLVSTGRDVFAVGGGDVAVLSR